MCARSPFDGVRAACVLGCRNLGRSLSPANSGPVKRARVFHHQYCGRYQVSSAAGAARWAVILSRPCLACYFESTHC